VCDCGWLSRLYDVILHGLCLFYVEFIQFVVRLVLFHVRSVLFSVHVCLCDPPQIVVISRVLLCLVE